MSKLPEYQPSNLMKESHLEGVRKYLSETFTSISDEDLKNFDINEFMSGLKEDRSMVINGFRHGSKNKISGLSEQGFEEARQKGNKIPWTEELVVVSVGSTIEDKEGKTKRAVDTAMTASETYAMEDLNIVDLPPQHDLSYFFEGKNADKFMKEIYPVWLKESMDRGLDKEKADGEIGKRLYNQSKQNGDSRIDPDMPSPHEMAARFARVILKEIIVGAKNTTDKKMRFMNGSHSWIVDYFILELCKEEIESDPIASDTKEGSLFEKYGDIVGPTEGFSLNIHTGDSTIDISLQFRGKEWNVSFDDLVNLAKDAPLES